MIGARHAAGLTQRELAVRLGRGRSPSYVAKIELGERNVDLVEFLSIARAIGVDEYELFRLAVSAVDATVPPQQSIKSANSAA